MRIGIQLYSVRDALAQDFEGTLRRVAAFGYEGVESFGQFTSARETRQILEGLGLEALGRHAAFEALVQGLEGELEFCLELGAPYLVCAWSKADAAWPWPRIAEELGRMAERAEAHGLKFAYHNHAHELLERVDDAPALDLLLAQPRVHAELDVAWLHAGGVDPAQYVRRYAARTPLLHVKDVARKGERWETVELGHGEVNLSAAVAAAQPEWLVVEQDHSPDPLGSARRNLEALRELL
ncbi:sugar phosphate isomerase/epimerase family protein [Calidithermus chliarophilus]|uniref:sugar phosphate isomerase/epimerase family protein n=1 Tax=Calidithermus chliarophilus TaxID=52023 RepID=UPI0004224FFA|nr:sugar phosphate isomerase/epimerase [Calidithermus chliarophilus]